MLLTITTTYQPATDLGYLLAKNPARVQQFDLKFGTAHVFYPEATPERCTAALLLDVDPIGLVRGRNTHSDGWIDQYVNDRPYVASSLLSGAIAEVFGSALNGRSRERAALAATPIPLEAQVTALPCQDGETLLRRLFEPLGYALAIESTPLDPRWPEWGDSPYYTVTLRATTRLSDLLTHLYVLIPVLDADKHYYVGPDEINKLLQRGVGWLATHPEHKLITRRYLKQPRYIQTALTRLLAGEAATPDENSADDQLVRSHRFTLHDLRLRTVADELRESGAQRVLDLGCGEGRLIFLLLAERQFTHILGMDIDHRRLEHLREKLDQLPALQRERVALIHGSLVYRDQRLNGFDAAALVEVIEHLDPARLAALERNVFEFARPTLVIATTPNAEYNVLFPTLDAGSLRHSDHRFEWTRREFAAWAERIAAQYGYTVQLLPLGPEAADVGAPSQMAVWKRESSA